ncbi:MAG: LLM class F420-dependent oxidoreductase [Deltaproteobacteria bacterium]|nr:LLM class F420-dependent oxidoreductase [Deltaproteobacteria bacterium]
MIPVGVFSLGTDLTVDYAELAKRAEELGFASFWLPEHPIIPVHCQTQYPGSADGSIPELFSHMVDPFITLAHISGATKQIKLGTGVCLVPERNPLLLAKEIATLDQLSGGRVLFGIGAGWLKEEIDIMGGDPTHPWAQTKESILAMKELWTKAEAEYHGKYYNFPAVRSFPKPLQKPHPPVLLGGGAKNVFKRIVAWGDGWLPTLLPFEEIERGRKELNALAQQAGRDPRSISVFAFGQAGQYRTRAEVEALERAGVNHATIWLTAEGAKKLTELEELARQVLRA